MTPEWSDYRAAEIASTVYGFGDDYGEECYPPTSGTYRQRAWKNVRGRGPGWKVMRCEFWGEIGDDTPYRAGEDVEGVVYLFGSGQRACTFEVIRNGYMTLSDWC
jgi:hypothetical protein